MKAHRSVHDVLDSLAALDGQAVEIEGVLGTETEGYEVLHYPKSQRRAATAADGPIYLSSLWLEFGTGSIQPNRQALKRWDGKRVRVHGIVHAPEARPATAFGKGGFGPYGFWPAAIEVYSIQRATSEQRVEGSD